ncbi:DNA-binding transcriptional regulator, MerR family [Actinacidiphila yanglinensis]|uniref:DNA-binding transcriptional regulator, MerR family n=1 Tax=Actinacidiphila yanglinensis TaxID=310779 RepID=A0A1H6E8F8_9ACTN|nr:MerR family transcriptional regulator [Actinacidiphila yanglinensis]SEG93214.1 DNA-binding transcriptional regulator, MerR family [Actinacidiphila yanglinensis]
MDGTQATAPLLTIGDLARRTGLPVRTIRYWSETGVVPEATRSTGGHRLYDPAGLARLELVATLRELGLSHAEVRRVLSRENTVAEVAAIHVAALDARITTLRLRRAVLSVIAAGDREEPEDMDRLNRMARLSAQERQQIIDDFAARVCEGLDAGTQLRDRLSGGGHRLPDAPTQEQLDAWLELSEMVQDPQFQQLARRAMEQSISSPARAGGAGRHSEPDRHRRFAQNLDRTIGSAMREGIAPDSPLAAEVVDRLLGDSGPERRTAVRNRLRAHLDAGIDERLERYRRLLAVMHGQTPQSPRAALYTWLADAIDAGSDPQVIEQH